MKILWIYFSICSFIFISLPPWQRVHNQLLHSKFLSLSNVTSSFLMQILIVLSVFAFHTASHFMVITQDLFLLKIMLYQQDKEHKRNPRKKLSWMTWKAIEHLFISFCSLKTLIIQERTVNRHLFFLVSFFLHFSLWDIRLKQSKHSSKVAKLQMNPSLPNWMKCNVSKASHSFLGNKKGFGLCPALIQMLWCK